MTQKSKNTATATLRCPDGCLRIEYQTALSEDDLDGDTDPRQFLNELGTPGGARRPDGKAACPGCDTALTVTWGDTDG